MSDPRARRDVRGECVTRATLALRQPQLAWQAGLDEPVVAIAAGQSALAAGGSEGSVLVMDPTGTQTARVDLGDALQCLAVAPDGRRLAAAGCTTRAMWSPDGAQVLRTDAGWCTAMAWTTAGDALAVVDGRRVAVLDRDGTVGFTSPPLASTAAGLAWLRGARRLAVGAYGAVHVLEPATRRTVHRFDGAGALTCLAAQPQGRWVVGGDQDLTVHGWRVPTGDDVRMRGFPTKITTMAFDGSGRWLATPSAEDVPVWDFSSPGPSNRAPMVATGHQDAVTALAWQPGADAVLVTGDAAGTLALWRIRGSGTGGTVHPGWTEQTDDHVTALAFVTATTFLVGYRSGALACYRMDPS